MNTKPVRTTGLLLVVFSVTTLGAQNASGDVAASSVKKAQHQRLNLCLMDEKTEAAERTTLETYSSPALENAMLSSTSFWDFITDPSTPYIDRMAAANRGGSMLSPEELPLLWQAMTEVSSVPSAHSPSPCSASAAIFRPPTDALDPGLKKSREEASRVVLGREIKLSQDTFSYPVTVEERNHSPWSWQMQKALSMLFDKTNLYYRGTRYAARVKAAWELPISASTCCPAGQIVCNIKQIDWNKIAIRSRALTEVAPHDVLLLQTILKLALDNDNYYVAQSANVDGLYAWGQDSYHYEELAHVAQIAVLQKTPWENVAAQAAFEMESLAQWKGDPVSSPNIKPLRTATGVLAIGRWAMDESFIPWNRYYAFAQPICRIVKDAPCPPDQLRDVNDPRLDERLRTFEAWFEMKKPALEQQAEAERSHLRSLANVLQTDIE